MKKSEMSAIAVLILILTPLLVVSSQESELDAVGNKFEKELIEQFTDRKILANTPYFKIFNGSTSQMGGGTIIGIISGTNLYGIVHGNESHQNSPHLFHSSERPVAIAEIKPLNKPYISKKIPITLKTILSTSINDLLEFEDNNGDSLFNIRRSSTNQTPTMLDGPKKLLDLSQANWYSSVSDITVEDTVALFNITVTAQNVPYNRTWPRSQVSNGILEEIEFLINFNFTLSDASPPDLPVFEFTGDRVTLKRTDRGYINVKNLICSTKYSIKISGWNFRNSENLLFLTTIFTFSEAVEVKGLAFMPDLLESKLGLRTELQYEASGNRFNASYDSPSVNEQLVKKIQGRILDIRNARGQLGSFGWSDDYTVDGNSRKTTMQLDGFYKREDHGITKSTISSFKTLLVYGGFIYAAGDLINHDPELRSSSFFFLDELPIVPPAIRSISQNNGLLLFTVTTVILVASMVWLKRR
ncbi:MAG: hypothetical protein ACXAEU_10655 [Candidatus Hodarchaeales archaeon]